MRKKKERERVNRGVAGNKRLANPPCQFNLASNPGEMLIRTSLPLCSALLHSTPSVSLSLFLSLSSGPVASPESLVARNAAQRNARALSRAATQRHFIFAQRYHHETGPRHVEIVCKASLHPPFLSSGRLFRSLLLLAALPLSAFHPRNLSRLCGGRAAESVPQRGIRRRTKREREEGGGGKEEKEEAVRGSRIRNTIVSPRSSCFASTFAAGEVMR